MNTRLYHRIIGHGEPLVLLHGWGWSSSIWEPLIPLLSQYFQVVMIDLPGFGQSQLNIDAYTIEKIAPLLINIVPDPAYWLGWSLGGMLAWELALHFPLQVKKLVTVAASPQFLASADWPGVTAATLQKFADSLADDYKKTLLDFLTLQLRGNPTNAGLQLGLQQQLPSSDKPSPALALGLAYLHTTNFRDKISGLGCNSLHIFGNQDVLVPAKVSSLIEPQLPLGECKIILKSGHIPFLSQPDIFNSILLEFLTAPMQP
jgi:pimeloyl-[acyl-carrier protein] methyl ester esterase